MRSIILQWLKHGVGVVRGSIGAVIVFLTSLAALRRDEVIRSHRRSVGHAAHDVDRGKQARRLCHRSGVWCPSSGPSVRELRDLMILDLVVIVPIICGWRCGWWWWWGWLRRSEQQERHETDERGDHNRTDHEPQ